MEIFLSYAHANEDLALQLRDIMTRGGHTVWTDHLIITGLDWRNVLENEIIKSSAVALAMSSDWIASNMCQWEFITAVEEGKYIIPVLLEHPNYMQPRYTRLEYADFTHGFGNDTEVDKFLEDLYQIAKTVHISEIADVNKEEYAIQIDKSLNIAVGDVGGQKNTVVNVNGNVNLTIGTLNLISNNPPFPREETEELVNLTEQVDQTFQMVPIEQQAEVIMLVDRTSDVIERVVTRDIQPDVLSEQLDSLMHAAENILRFMPGSGTSTFLFRQLFKQISRLNRL